MKNFFSLNRTTNKTMTKTTITKTPPLKKKNNNKKTMFWGFLFFILVLLSAHLERLSGLQYADSLLFFCSSVSSHFSLCCESFLAPLSDAGTDKHFFSVLSLTMNAHISGLSNKLLLISFIRVNGYEVRYTYRLRTVRRCSWPSFWWLELFLPRTWRTSPPAE